MTDFTSAKIRLLALRITRFAALLSIFYNVMISFQKDLYLVIILTSLIIITAANDYIREKFLKNHKSIWYYLSFTLSNVMETYFSYKVKCVGVVVYSIVLVIDMLLFNEKIPVLLIIVNFIAFCIPYKINPNPADNVGLQEIFLNYLNITVVVYIVRSVIRDKAKTEKLNKELTNANLKLKEYSKKIEEFTISKERTRIAQELHDSIGHSLVALRMNLEYAESVVELKPEKAKEVIKKSNNISKDCITKLREVVSVLKEDTTIKNLREGINELFENFRDNERYEFNLKMDDDIEMESPNIKVCIYKTVMEGITNGIKHGNAHIFSIEINKVQNNIILKVSNNGLGCTDIKKSNGINGIEKRIADLDGSVKLYSENNIGFIIDVVIPLRGGNYDKDYNC